MHRCTTRYCEHCLALAFPPVQYTECLDKLRTLLEDPKTTFIEVEAAQEMVYEWVRTGVFSYEDFTYALAMFQQRVTERYTSDNF